MVVGWRHERWWHMPMKPEAPRGADERTWVLLPGKSAAWRMGCSSREWNGNGKCASKRQKSRSRPGGREDEIEWARHIAGAATLGRSSGFGRSYASGLPVRNCRLENLHYNDSGSIATKNVHHSGASAAEFHRLPDAPKVMRNIPLLFLNASFIDLVAAEAWVAGAEDWRRLAGRVLRWA